MDDKQLCTIIPKELHQKLKILSSSNLISIKLLLVEAITDLVIKYERNR